MLAPTALCREGGNRALVQVSLGRSEIARGDVRWSSVPLESFVPFEHPGHTPPATHVRSTLIVSSMQAFRARGIFDAYAAQLSTSSRNDLMSLIAGTWVPIDLGLSHYRAADGLGLDSGTIDAIGGDVGERVNKTALSLVVKLSKQSGVTPWTALARAHRLKELSWQGSDVAVWKLGPKDARFDWLGMPYASIPYYVTSLGGFLRGLIQLFSTKAYTKTVPERCSPTSVSYRISWA
jgi:hypothetical protein